MIDIVKRVVFQRDALRAKLLENRQNRLYGKNAPKYGEQIWIDTASCTRAVAPAISRRKSGLVQSGNWDANTEPVEDIPKIKYCLAHWVDGLSWEEASANQFMLDLISIKGTVDHCQNINDIVARFSRLDEVYETVRDQRMLLPSSEVRAGFFRECGGIYVHIDRNGNPLFGGGGNHRFAIAKSIGLDFFPAQVGMVHREALDLFPAFRRQPTRKPSVFTPDKE